MNDYTFNETTYFEYLLKLGHIAELKWEVRTIANGAGIWSGTFSLLNKVLDSNYHVLSDENKEGISLP